MLKISRVDTHKCAALLEYAADADHVSLRYATNIAIRPTGTSNNAPTTANRTHFENGRRRQAARPSVRVIPHNGKGASKMVTHTIPLESRMR